MSAEMVVILEAALALLLALSSWFAAALFNRITDTLDKTAARLQDVAETTAAHGARLDAIEAKR